jgi:hypothetical protein
MIQEPLVVVNLTDTEAQLFIKFQKHFALINILEGMKAFDIKNGSVTIHFDSQGKIGVIEKNESFRV